MCRRISIWPYSALLMLVSGCQSLVNHYVLPSDGIRPATYSVTVHSATMVTSDGVSLVADIYLPQPDRPRPTILVRIPFSRSFKNDLGAAAIGRFWARRGYNVVIQGSRGRYKSGGDYYPLRNERSDGIETCAGSRSSPGSTGGSGCGAAPFLATPSGCWQTNRIRDRRR